MKTLIIAGMVGLVALLGSTAEAEGTTLEDEAEAFRRFAADPTRSLAERARWGKIAQLATAIDKRMKELNSAGAYAGDDPELLRLRGELSALSEVSFAEQNNQLLAIYRRQVEKAEAQGQDGHAIRQECEDRFKSIAVDYRANFDGLQGLEAQAVVAEKERAILSNIPECWR